MTRNLAKALAAAAFVGAMAVWTATPSAAQGVYLDGPGFDVRVGHPWYRHNYYYRGPYADYGYRHHYWRHRYWDRW
jgi:hypothetical protein